MAAGRGKLFKSGEGLDIDRESAAGRGKPYLSLLEGRSFALDGSVREVRM